MSRPYTVDLSLEACVSRLSAQQHETHLENGYTLSVIVTSLPIGVGLFRVEVTRTVRGWRRRRKSAVYVFLRRTGGTITRVTIRNTEQTMPMIFGILLVAFGIISANRGSLVVAGLCVLLGAVVLVIIWMLYTGRLVPQSLVDFIKETLPERAS